MLGRQYCRRTSSMADILPPMSGQLSAVVVAGVYPDQLSYIPACSTPQLWALVPQDQSRPTIACGCAPTATSRLVSQIVDPQVSANCGRGLSRAGLAIFTPARQEPWPTVPVHGTHKAVTTFPQATPTRASGVTACRTMGLCSHLSSNILGILHVSPRQDHAT